MRGALQARASGLPGAVSVPWRSSWTAVMSRRRSRRSARRLEMIERAYRRQRREKVYTGFDPRRPWIRQL
jgi:hypothetical protein